MTGVSTAFVRGVAIATGLLGIAGLVAAMAGSAYAGSASAGKNGSSYNIGSLASQFLQSKAQMHVLDDDDKVAPGCQQKRFVKADVIRKPTVNAVGGKGVTERKWTEQWTLDRCGTAVPYYVFFTEVGQGGAYFSVVRP